MSARTARLAIALAPALLFVLFAAGAATAQSRVEEKVNLTVTGDVTAIDPDARTITVKSTHDEEGVVYQVDRAATIMSGAQDVPLSDVKVGWNVAMNGHRTGEDRVITMIKVVKAP